MTSIKKLFSTGSAKFPRRRTRVAWILMTSILLLVSPSCSPAANLSNAEAVDPQPEGASTVPPSPALFVVEAFILESDQPFVDNSYEAITAAARGDTSGLLLAGAGTGSLRERLEAAHAAGKIRILVAPSFLTPDGQSVTTQSGLQVPVQTVTNDAVTIQYVNATLRLDATPTAVEGGTIALDVNVQKRYPDRSLQKESSQWPIQTTEMRAQARIADGGTAVFAGIYETRLSHAERGKEFIALITVRTATL